MVFDWMNSSRAPTFSLGAFTIDSSSLLSQIWPSLRTTGSIGSLLHNGHIRTSAMLFMYVGKTSWFAVWMSFSLPSCCCCSTWSSFDWLHVPFQLESVVVAVAAAPTVNAESFIWNADMDEAIGQYFPKRPSSLSVSRMFICNPLTSSLLTTAWIKTLNVVYDIARYRTRDYSAHDPHVT